MNDGRDVSSDVTAIVFDMTGVITRSPLDAIEAYSVAAGARRETVLKHFRSEAFRQVLLGARSMRGLVRDIVDDTARTDGVTLSPDLLLGAMRVGQQIEPEIAELIGELSSQYRLAVLTNNTTDVVDTADDGSRTWWSDDSGLALTPSDFSLVMSSSDLGLLKPDAKIYRELLRRLGVRGHEVVYIDDQASNLPAAAALGMKTLHFLDAGQCRSDLRDLGIAVSVPTTS